MKSEKSIDKLLLIILGIFALSLPVSKVGINASAGLFVLASLYKFTFNTGEIKELYRNNKNIFNFSLLIFVGIIINLISPGGIESAKKYFFKSLYFLMIPGMISVLDNNNKKIFERIFFFSVFIGIVKSYFVFFEKFKGVYQNWIRVDSFYDIGRWSTILLFTLAVMFPSLVEKDGKKKKVAQIVFFIMALVSLILSNSRGPWISLVLTSFFYFIIYGRKKLKYALLIISLLTVIVVTNNKYSEWKERVASIGQLENPSNKGRLLMWREASIFFLKNSKNTLILTGTGVENFKEIYIEYLGKNNKLDSLSKETTEFSFSDNHNIYLNLINQMGIFYFLLYAYILFNLIKEIYVKSKEQENREYRSIILLLLSFFICGVFYGYIFTYEMFTVFFLIIIKFKFKNMNYGG